MISTHCKYCIVYNLCILLQLYCICTCLQLYVYVHMYVCPYVLFKYRYKAKHEMQFFGRGQLAGIDINAQKKSQSQFYNDMMEKRRTDEQKDKAEYD